MILRYSIWLQQALDNVIVLGGSVIPFDVLDYSNRG
jgi:hypothetical protein